MSNTCQNYVTFFAMLQYKNSHENMISMFIHFICMFRKSNLQSIFHQIYAYMNTFWIVKETFFKCFIKA